MTTYVPPEQQLVVEIFVRDAARAKGFYQQLGFAVSEDRGTFVVLTWEGHELFLDERSGLTTPSSTPQANVRVMVADVDAYWLARRRWAPTCSRRSPIVTAGCATSPSSMPMASACGLDRG